jgi:hypothetical protein
VLLGWQEGRGGPIDQNMYYVENIFEELDAPNEWYLDTINNKLYYYPRNSISNILLTELNLAKNVNVHNSTFVAAVLRNVIEVRGFASHPVQNIKFINLNITHSATTYMNVTNPIQFVFNSQPCVIG